MSTTTLKVHPAIAENNLLKAENAALRREINELRAGVPPADVKAASQDLLGQTFITPSGGTLKLMSQEEMQKLKGSTQTFNASQSASRFNANRQAPSAAPNAQAAGQTFKHPDGQTITLMPAPPRTGPPSPAMLAAEKMRAARAKAAGQKTKVVNVEPIPDNVTAAPPRQQEELDESEQRFALLDMDRRSDGR